ncbi:MAG: hypothetical protein SGPRY_001353 [Prymnesium sp.]
MESRTDTRIVPLQASLIAPDVEDVIGRADALRLCLASAHGATGWRRMSTVGLTHACLQLVFSLLARSIVPRHSPLAPSRMSELLHVGSPIALLFLFAHSWASVPSPLTDGFMLASLLYCLGWLPALLQLPLRLPFYPRAWGGECPQWTMRPPLRQGLAYAGFWGVVLGLKWLFEYRLVVSSLYRPTRALWEGDYRCWDHFWISNLCL